jgi:hypothetical protein
MLFLNAFAVVEINHGVANRGAKNLRKVNTMKIVVLNGSPKGCQRDYAVYGRFRFPFRADHHFFKNPGLYCRK